VRYLIPIHDLSHPCAVMHLIMGEASSYSGPHSSYWAQVAEVCGWMDAINDSCSGTKTIRDRESIAWHVVWKQKDLEASIESSKHVVLHGGGVYGEQYSGSAVCDYGTDLPSENDARTQQGALRRWLPDCKQSKNYSFSIFERCQSLGFTVLYISASVKLFCPLDHQRICARLSTFEYQPGKLEGPLRSE
jgi:hypothetical protein